CMRSSNWDGAFDYW
nr:immunoglobulin heavy chain junction region [Mus musculus]